MAHSWGARLHQYIEDWLIRAESLEGAQLNTDCSEPNPVLWVDCQSKVV